MDGRSRRWLAAALTVGMTFPVAACGAEQASSGPVEVEYWAWAPNIEPVVAKFNETHTDLKIKFVKQADNPTTATGLRNAVAAGQNVPCIVQSFGEVPSLLAEGLLADVTEHLTPYVEKRVFTDTAVKGVTIGGKYFGVPAGAAPSFLMINRAVYDQYGIAVPKTWDDVIAAGVELKPHGVQVMNLAGEDPSTLINLVQQAGGTWYSVQDDAWRIGFTSPESRKAAAVVQQLVDNGIVANQTYTDRPALISYFDQGKMVSLPTATWQLANYETNFKKSIGDWQPVDLPQYADAPTFVTPAHGAATLIPKGCKDLAAATEAAVWLNSSKDAIDASYLPETGAHAWPGAIPDPSPWVESVVPKNLFGDRRAEAVPVILKATKAGIDPWIVGPNYTGVFKELQDQWALAVTRKITFAQLLDHMQTYTTDDLKTKGINVASS
ncbi:ABC transporter substrate-binding protein [Actinoplanes derwentensis]|uniref:Multiple sugar transport system substrate-binding protein n=1 Tax=Actinoplanes derwentensis TaxID=113562 RepID=A0A1H1X9V7_9ACTN|nr:extracellular solute-binding protein [Actinoplanes derwentensis]GID89616.1 sugar ABC transporter substrate-binding protein [Actinoplanes derwentensis]SDT06097.1 multiple sugar transport system substrate-binding protein [Actinoplanes derwentensis]